eukprot:GDKJ01054258.1.p1 GENE.GDKJ01054258.1~~GDKJ01054258.1.p1  ORF type:complete len:123 (+),score=9.86 GDKJ01054258.1:130-498(+)
MLMNSMLSNILCAPLSWSSKALQSTHRSFFEVKFRKSGRSPSENVSFNVRRTPSGNLPVYTSRGMDGEVVTIVKLRGNFLVAQKQLISVCNGSPVREGGSCKLEVRGEHDEKIKRWLISLGF